VNTKKLETVTINPVAKPAWAVIWLHGLGADGHDFEPIVPELQLPEQAAVRFVFPHAPFAPVTINGGMIMRAWYDIREVNLGRNVDAQGIRDSSDLLRNLIQRELESGLSSERIILAGFSQGGAVVLHTALRFEMKLAGVLALSTYSPTLDTLGAERGQANAALPILMAHGRYDPLIPMALAVDTRDKLSRLGYAVQWHDYPMQHEVCIEEIRDVGQWLKRILQLH